MIRLRFSKGSGIGAGIVRAATWSPYAHVGFSEDAGRVLDATPEHGVALRDTDLSSEAVFYAISLPDFAIYRAVDWARTQIGKPYDWRALVGFALHRDWHDDEAWFCSELVAGAFDAVGYPLLRTEHLDRITPRDLALSPYLIPLVQTGGVGCRENC